MAAIESTRPYGPYIYVTNTALVVRVPTFASISFHKDAWHAAVDYRDELLRERDQQRQQDHESKTRHYSYRSPYFRKRSAITKKGDFPVGVSQYLRTRQLKNGTFVLDQGFLASFRGKQILRLVTKHRSKEEAYAEVCAWRNAQEAKFLETCAA